jgi:hypothetical protein
MIGAPNYQIYVRAKVVTNIFCLENLVVYLNICMGCLK